MSGISTISNTTQAQPRPPVSRAAPESSPSEEAREAAAGKAREAAAGKAREATAGKAREAAAGKAREAATDKARERKGPAHTETPAPRARQGLGTTINLKA